MGFKGTKYPILKSQLVNFTLVNQTRPDQASISRT